MIFMRLRVTGLPSRLGVSQSLLPKFPRRPLATAPPLGPSLGPPPLPLPPLPPPPVRVPRATRLALRVTQVLRRSRRAQTRLGLGLLLVSGGTLLLLAPPVHQKLQSDKSAKQRDKDAAMQKLDLQLLPPPDSMSPLFAASLLLRFLSLGLLFLPALLAMPVFLYLNSRFRARLYGADRLDGVKGLWFVSLLSWSLQAGGPAFVKLAQYASSREDLFSHEVCRILGKLQDRGVPHSMYHTRKVFRNENIIVLNVNDAESTQQAIKFDDLFDQFDETPVGVGAIAQVYRARLKNSHQVVAVKIVHPHVVNLINKDLIILKILTETMTALFPGTLKWLSLPDEVAVFSEMMRAQTDMRTEANNLIQFRSHFKSWAVANSDGGGAVWFPRPLLTSPSILVEEFIDAIPVSRFLGMQHALLPETDDLVIAPLSVTERIRQQNITTGTPYDIQLAKIGMRSFVKMLLVDNFCHADLHPGNIQVAFVANDEDTCVSDEVMNQLPAGVETLHDLDRLSDVEFLETMRKFQQHHFTPRLVYLDAGLISTLSQTNLINLNDLLAKIVQFDGHGVAKLLVERQRIDSSATSTAISDSSKENTGGGVIDFDGFSAKMSSLLNRIRDSSLKLSTVSFSWILRQVFEMVRTHHVRLEGDFANVGVAVMLVEGVGRTLDPGVDLLEEVRGVVIREWVLAVGDLWAVRAVLEIYSYAKQVGRDLVSEKWPVFAK